MIILIAAIGENNELGKENGLLWHLPDDFKRFKKLTSHHFLIMGRKTFESLDGPLPDRVHIVLTENRSYGKTGAVVVYSMEEALRKAESKKDVYIIGGGEIYSLALEHADKMELTRVHGSFPEADTFFPEFSKDEWELVSENRNEKDDRHKYAFTYETWVRKKK